jgi:sugar O-acyltransferase (sialic acid O-acetyltransferase NeuD family)
LAESCRAGEDRFEVVGFIDDNEEQHSRLLNEVPVMGLKEAAMRFPDAQIVAAVGSPSARETAMTKAEAHGLRAVTLVHERVEKSRWIEIGIGTVICAGNVLTTNIRLGRHVQINLDCTIGHDAILDDYATLAPGVHISGWVHLGKRAYVGTGAVIINGTEKAPIVIGDDAVIGAGACVTKSVEPGVTVTGVPARAR